MNPCAMHAALEKFITDRSAIDEISLQKIAACFHLIKTKKNEILLHFDEVCKNYYFINKGAVRLFTIAKDGSDSSRYFAFEGQFVTALPSFIDQKPAEEYLQTIEKAELLSVSRADFYHLTESVPQFAKIYTEI